MKNWSKRLMIGFNKPRIKSTQINQRDPLDIKRIQALTDSAFAVAMTVLILDIRMPKGLNDSSVLNYMQFKISSSLSIYFLSFITLGIFWVGTHYHHHLILKTDKTSSWFNI